MSAKYFPGVAGPYYKGQKLIAVKTELWATVAHLLSKQRGGKTLTQKAIRDAYILWVKGTYVKTISFAEFVEKMYGGPSGV